MVATKTKAVTTTKRRTKKEDDRPIFYQAIDACNGFTYLSVGAGIGLYNKALLVTREAHVGNAGTRALIRRLG